VLAASKRGKSAKHGRSKMPTGLQFRVLQGSNGQNGALESFLAKKGIALCYFSQSFSIYDIGVTIGTGFVAYSGNDLRRK